VNDLEAVVFDVDGTLVDSERDGHRVAFNQAFAEFGLPDEWDIDTYGRLLKITGGQRRLHTWLSERGMPVEERNDLVPRLHARKTEVFNELVAGGKIHARPGVTALLDAIAADGLRLAVATTGTRAWVIPLIARMFGSDRFEVVVTGDEAPERKPDPSAYNVALSDLGITAAAVAVEEDSRNGLEAAAGATLPCAVVVNGYTTDQDFTEAGIVLDSFGTAEEPAKVLADRLGLAPPGRLDPETLRRLRAKS